MSKFNNHRQLATVFIFIASLIGAMPVIAANQIGVYWDAQYGENATYTTAPFEFVTGHLVITEEAFGGGILAWECAVDVTGPGTVTSWQIEGQAINAQSPPSFAVGLASPLPSTGSVLLASFELLVTEIAPIEVALNPIYFASIPDQMGYIDANEPDIIKVMTPVTGDPVVATVNAFTGTWCGTDWVHVVYFGGVEVGESLTRNIGIESCGGLRLLDIAFTCDDPTLSLPGLSGQVIVQNDSFVVVAVTYTPTEPVALDCALDFGDFAFPVFGHGLEPVGLETPTPRAIQQGGLVELEWPSHGVEGDQYHVYRKDPQGQESRLTDTPLVATTTLVQFSDRPNFPGGTVLRYSYAIVREGVEWARSPDVEVTVKSLPQFSTRLLTNVPNPFNPQTKIRFELARDEFVRVTIFDVTGRRVRTLVDGRQSAGENSVVWQGRDNSGRQVASGAYYVRLETGRQVLHQKIMMLK